LFYTLTNVIVKLKQGDNMSKAKSGDTVKVNYTGKLKDGSVFDSSENKDPLQFKIGARQVIPGFEQAVLGMEPGDSKDIEISANDAYGPYNDKLVVKVPKDKIPAELNPSKGQQLRLQQPDGNDLIVKVKDIDDKDITLDANHQLAGQDLLFNVQLVEIT
jgi:FKBP-type peptidyl-prolyl cis-trans isomerase 2